MQELTKIILGRTCPYCHALAGAWCHSPKSWEPARYLHAARGDQVYAAWRVGWREGEADGQRLAADVLENDGTPPEALMRKLDVVAWLRRRADG